MTTTAAQPVMRIEEVRIGERVRKDMGDIDVLADSIAHVGLRQPINVDPDGNLIGGHRRLIAFARVFPGEPIPVFVTPPESAVDALVAERDENTCRKAFEPSELIALGKRIEALYLPAALEKMSEGGREAGRGRPNAKGLPRGANPIPPHDTRELTAKALGISRSEYQRLRAVDTATRHPDPAVATVAKKAIVDLDTGEITPTAADALVREAKKAANPDPKPKQDDGPRRVRKGGRTHAQVCEAISHQLTGIASSTTALSDLDPTLPADQLRRWVNENKKSLAQNNRFQRQLITALEGTES